MSNEKISVTLTTWNEAANIRNCLESVRWADEIIVVDMYSDDNTVEIARQYTDQIFSFKNTGYVEPSRQFAVDQTHSEWILVMDADEMVPRKLRDCLRRIAAEDTADVVYLYRHNYFFGHLMEGGGWGYRQDRHARFFKKSFVQFSDAIHRPFQLVNEPRVLQLSDPDLGFLHFNYLDLEHFLEKMNRYTTVEAQNMYQGLKPVPSVFSLMVSIGKEILGRWLLKKGYRDGIQGFYLSCLMGAYQLASFAKARLMQARDSTHPRVVIERQYAEIAQKVLAEYREQKRK